MQTYKFFPGGNTTLLIDNLKGQISPNDYASYAKDMLRDEVEQIGYIEKGKKSEYRLAMMGGEFCINALRSLAMWNYEKSGQKTFFLECSGTDELFELQVKKQKVSILLKKKEYQIERISQTEFLVYLDGIAHVVSKDFQFKSEQDMKMEFFSRIYPSVIEKTTTYDAIGYIGLSADGLIFPLVYVKPTETLIFESACGSGTLAAFLVDGSSRASFIQPSQIPFTVCEEDGSYKLESEVLRIL